MSDTAQPGSEEFLANQPARVDPPVISENVAEARADVERLRVEHETAAADSERIAAELAEALTKRAALDDDASGARKVLAEHTEKVKHLNRQASDLTRSLAYHQSEAARLHAQVDPARADVGTKEQSTAQALQVTQTAAQHYGTTRTALASAETQRDAALDVAKSADETLSVAVTERDTVAARKDSYARLLAARDADRTALAADLDHVRAACDRAADGRDRLAAFDETPPEATRFREDAEAYVTALAEAKRTVEGRAAAIAAQTDETQTRLAEETATLVDAERAVADAERAATQCRADAERLVVAYETARQQAVAAHTAHADASMTSDQATSALNHARMSLTNLITTRDRALQAISEHKRSIEDVNGRIAEAMRIKAEAEAMLSDLEAARASLNGQIEVLQRDDQTARFHKDTTRRRYEQGRNVFVQTHGEAAIAAPRRIGFFSRKRR